MDTREENELHDRHKEKYMKKIWSTNNGQR